MLLRKIVISIRFLYYSLIYVFDKVFVFSLSFSRPLQNEIFIIKTDNIGDYVLWIDSLKLFEKAYPKRDYKKRIILNNQVRDLHEFINSKYFDETIYINLKKYKTSLLYRLKMMRMVAGLRSGVAINLVYSRDLLCSESLLMASLAPKKLGFHGDNLNNFIFFKSRMDLNYTSLIGFNEKANELILIKEFFKFFKIEFDPFIGNFQKNGLDKEKGLDIGSYFVVFPGAGKAIREWPIEKFIEIIKYLEIRFGLIGVICGSRRELKYVEEINLQRNRPLLSLVGDTDLVALANVIKNAKILITNETSAAHIGAAWGTPTVAIVGGGHFGRFLPYPNTLNPKSFKVVNMEMECYECNWECKYLLSKRSPAPCISDISVNQVLTAIDSLIGRE
ncbi:MAG: glycosyltransferase family 9 protein [Polynucleobacter sp.]|nr:glycosyltransferase family 9 protein [Polynucleobacter sp.]